MIDLFDYFLAEIMVLVQQTLYDETELLILHTPYARVAELFSLQFFFERMKLEHFLSACCAHYQGRLFAHVSNQNKKKKILTPNYN